MFYNAESGAFAQRPIEDHYPRVSLSPAQRETVFESSRGPDGKVVCPCGGEVVTSQASDMDSGHKPGHEYAASRDRAIASSTPRADFRDDQKNPANYRAEHPSCNRSGRYEQE